MGSYAGSRSPRQPWSSAQSFTGACRPAAGSFACAALRANLVWRT